jgi:formate C-acetyltransferase
MRFGGGILAVYNEDTVIDALIKDGYEEREARRFANDGCWEVQIPGKTYFGYIPFDSLQILQKITLKEYKSEVCYPDFESLYQDYLVALRGAIEEVTRPRREKCNQRNENGEWIWKVQTPCTVVSLFERGCIEKGRSYFEGGPHYNIISPHIGGLADAVNALYALKKLVFDEKKLSLNAFLSILKNNWEGEEALRQYVLTHYAYYGNDNDEVDSLCARLLSDFADLCKELDGTCAYHFPAGVSTFGRQIEWSPKRLAAPHGRKLGEILAGNSSPTPGFSPR